MDLAERAGDCRRHPWETVRAEFFLRLLAGHAPTDARTFLDVGAGDSWFGEQVMAAPEWTGADIVCWDSAYTDADLDDAPVRVTRTRVAPEGTFDVVLLLDVLEHIDDPIGFLDDAVRPCLGPQTTILASVPVHPRLFGPHDRALGHRRRYRPDDFLAELAGVGKVVVDGPLFLSLTVLRGLEVAVSRWREPQWVGIGQRRHGAAVTALLEGGLRVDGWICRRLSGAPVPIRGLSHWAIARAS